MASSFRHANKVPTHLLTYSCLRNPESLCLSFPYSSTNRSTKRVLAPAAPSGPALLLFVNEEGALFEDRACLQDLKTLYFMTFFICIMKALIPSVINHIKNCFLE